MEGGRQLTKVDEMLRLMGNITSIPLTDHCMPCGTKLGIHSAFDVTGHILFYGKLFECVVGDLDGFRLHFFAHVDILDDGFEVTDVGGWGVGGAGGRWGGEGI